MDTTSTIVAEVVTSDGTACWRGLDQIQYQSTPASTFAESQSGRIHVDVGHQGPPIGWIDFLEHRPDSHNGALMAVAVVDADAELVDGLFCSPSIRCDALHTVERHSYRLDRSVRSFGTLTATRSILDSVAIVARTAGVTSTKIKAFPGDYRDVIDWGMMKARRPPPILERAKAAATWQLRTARPQQLRIHRPDATTDDRHAEPRVAAAGGSGRMIRLPDGSYTELRYGAPGRILGIR